MIRGGYILQPRIIKESDIFKAPPCVREIWSYLLREANSSDNKYGGHTIKRGQLFRDYRTIRDDLAWYVGFRKEMYGESQLKNAMSYLRKTQRIITRKKLGGVLITIYNYEYYQNPKNYERTKEETKERTNAELLPNQSLPDNNKKKKNNKNERKNILSQVDKSTLDTTSLTYFEIAYSFWELIRNHLLSGKNDQSDHPITIENDHL